jgi:hypothetical protein
MLALYRNGATLKQIGERYGITRERVRQILTKLYGMDARHGGARVIARRRAISHTARKDAKCLDKHGCSYAQYKELIEMGRSLTGAGIGAARTPVRAFAQQRNNALRCGYPWKLTLWQWWTVWQKSGHWSERGRGNGYWLTRRDKTGPFIVENVFIARGEDSWSEASPRRAPRGVLRSRAP